MKAYLNTKQSQYSQISETCHENINIDKKIENIISILNIQNLFKFTKDYTKNNFQNSGTLCLPIKILTSH